MKWAIKWCGLANIIGVAFEFAMFVVLVCLSQSSVGENIPLRSALGHVSSSIAWLAWAFLAFSPVKKARLLVFWLGLSLVSILCPGMSCYLVSLLTRMVLLVLLIVLVVKNDGKIRSALVFFLLAVFVSLPDLMLEHLITDELLELSKVFAAFSKVLVVAGSLTLLFDLNSSSNGAEQTDRVPLHWRLFVLAVPLIALSAFPAHIRMVSALAVPFCAFILYMVAAKTIVGCLFAGWSFVALSALVVIACTKERKTFKIASVVFIVIALFNIVGGAFFFWCFGLGGVH